MRSNKFAAVAWIVSTLALGTASAQPADLVVNGSFEEYATDPSSWTFPYLGDLNVPTGSTDITGWVVTGSQVDYIMVWQASDGERSVDLNGNPGKGGLAQTLFTMPGQRYTVQFDMAGNHDIAAFGEYPIKIMRIEVDGGTQSAEFVFNVSGFNNNNMGWVTRTWEFVAMSNITTLEFRSVGSDVWTGPVLDNVSVVETAEADEDQDGIPDYRDFCGSTPAGSGVGPDGCIICVLDPDDDGDGYPASADCDDADSSVNPGATEACNAIDDDCDTSIDEDFDVDGDGFTSCQDPSPDCNDSDATINPDSLELPGNTVDEDCDGSLGACDPINGPDGNGWRNHGEYVRCVSHEVDDLLAAGLITEEEGDALVRSAAQSDVGR